MAAKYSCRKMTLAKATSIIGLILLTCTLGITRASPYGSMVSSSPRSQISCPDRLTTTCSCSYFSEYEIECPANQPTIIVRIYPSKFVQFECTSQNESIYRQLPQMKIGETTNVQFRRCPLPGGNSLQTIFDHLGIQKIRALIFSSVGVDLGNTLKRHHLTGLTDLDSLRLNGNGISDLPEDLFHDVENITWLDLKSNKVHLPANIFANLKKLNLLELGYNNLKTLEPGLFRNQENLKSLNLWGNDLLNLTAKSFEGLTALEDLDLSANYIENFEPTVFNKLKNLTNINLSTNNFTFLPEGLFKENKNLRRMKLMYNRAVLTTLPSGLLANLSQLDDVQIECDLETISSNVFEGSINIKNLSLKSNKLKQLPWDLFTSQTNLLDLDLSHNSLMELDDRLFETTHSILVLKLSHNNISIITQKLFFALQSVQQIHLNDNNLHMIHPLAFTNTQNLLNLQLQNNNLKFVTDDEEDGSYKNLQVGATFQHLNDLKILNLRNNSVRTILPDWNLNNFNLEELDLSHNNISYITFSDIQFSQQAIKVNLTYNKIQEINFLEADVITTANVRQNKVEIDLNNNPLHCNCLIYHFINFIKSKNYKTYMINVDNLLCASPSNMIAQRADRINPKNLLCLLDSPNSEIKLCPSNCSCFFRIDDRAVIINCSNAQLNEIPYLPNTGPPNFHSIELNIENNRITELPNLSDNPNFNFVGKLFARNNTIGKIAAENLPQNLTELDLRENKMNLLNASAFDNFYLENGSMQLSNLLLSGNPWKCDCKAVNFWKFTKKNFKIINDYNRLACDNGKKFIDITKNICPDDEILIYAVSIVLALFGLLISIIAALYYKYQQEVKVWLYANKWCMWFVTEEELDKDKKFDAFISYSHKDVDFVTEQIVPELENGSPPFKLCLHERDWIAGEFITDSISRSVEDSRRTIVILSPNFLESIWGKMEFQVAHKNAMKEGRIRVIIVIYGDIGDIEKLDPALQSYLKTNTYIKWGDPWFWKKLRYSLPHPDYLRKGLIRNTLKSSVDDKLELIKPVPTTPPLTTPPAEMAGQKFLNDNNKFNGHANGHINGHVNGAFIINTNAKQSDV